mgnify:CR=1 FL=1
MLPARWEIPQPDWRARLETRAATAVRATERVRAATTPTAPVRERARSAQVRTADCRSRPRVRPLDPDLVHELATRRGHVAGDVDDALDELEPGTLGVLDDDDVAAAHAPNADRERPVAGFQRRAHRRAGHLDPERSPALEPVRCSDTGEQGDEHRLPRSRTAVVGSGHGTPIVRRRERMLEALLRPRRVVHAHCDLPCGIYDPAQARVEAESVKAIQTRYQDAEKFKTAGEAWRTIGPARWRSRRPGRIWSRSTCGCCGPTTSSPSTSRSTRSSTTCSGTRPRRRAWPRGAGSRAGSEAAGLDRRDRQDLLGDQVVGIGSERGRAGRPAPPFVASGFGRRVRSLD